MTAKMTDAEIVKEILGDYWFTSESPTDVFVVKSVLTSYRLAESIYLPQIQQLQNEVERLNKEIQSLHEEAAGADL